MKRYKFTKNTKQYYSVTLKQIQAVADFGYAKKGDLGGYIKDESCLPQDGTGWVYPNGLNAEHPRCSSLRVSTTNFAGTIHLYCGDRFTVNFSIYPVKNGGNNA